jgi:2-methylcitrate dehydratase PrpD
MTSITGQLADFCAGLRTRSLPETVLDHTAAVLLDWLGAALAGASSESSALTRRLEPLLGGPRVASMVGCAQRASICLAALHNGTSSSVHALDDVHLDAAIHPSVVVIPAALAVAEATRCGARELLGGIVAGYEVMARVGWMLGPSHYHQWHTTSTSGCFGAAAAGVVWGLDPERLGTALGLAGAQAGGVWEGINREAVMVKHFHGGRAAVAGILAAYLARTGYPGAARVLEGERGLVAAASQSTTADIQTAMASLGTDFMVQRNFFKRYPCSLGNFQGLDAVASLATRSRIAADEVEAVIVRLASTSAWIVGNTAPTSIFEAKFSLPFAIATLLTVGRLGFAEYADHWLNDPQVRDLMGRVQLVVDDALAADAAIVEIHTRGGQQLEGRAPGATCPCPKSSTSSETWWVACWMLSGQPGWWTSCTSSHALTPQHSSSRRWRAHPRSTREREKRHEAFNTASASVDHGCREVGLNR